MAKPTSRKTASSEPKPKDPLALEIGRRIALARDDAGLSMSELARRSHTGLRVLNRYVHEGMMPGVRALMRIADTCGVSIDWLVRGTEHTPEALDEWLDGPVGQGVDEATRQLLRALPLRGYRPSTRFYDLALHAIREGLAPDEIARAARATERR